MSRNMYIDFHVIQTVPPSCVNRDDTGSPKTAMYGGVMRARVSSQAWKRAMRQMFKELFTSEHMGYRTKKLSELAKLWDTKNLLSQVVLGQICVYEKKSQVLVNKMKFMHLCLF